MAVGDAEGVQGLGDCEGGVLGSWISSGELCSGDDNEVNIAHAMFIHWGDGDAIETDTLAMMVNVVGANDGSEFFGTQDIQRRSQQRGVGELGGQGTVCIEQGR